MAKAPKWTPDDIATATAMRLAGAKSSEIAVALGRSLGAVKGRLFALGVQMPPERLRELRREQAAAMVRCENYRDKRGAAISAAFTPERRAAAGQLARSMQIWQMGAHKQSREDKVAAAAKGRQAHSKKRLGWCPQHLLAHYRSLTLGGRERWAAADARRMVTEEWVKQLRHAMRQIAEVAPLAAAEQAKRRNSLEGQLARLQAGAKLVPTFRPQQQVSDDRSLTGNSGAMAAYGGGV
jgi:hypothetical protein